MTIFLILFFTSFLGIIGMIGRKLMLFQNGQITSGESLSVSDLQEIKYAFIKNFKRYEYALLSILIKSYLLSLNALKNNYQKIKGKINKNENNAEIIIKEKSKFLKMIGDYKQKIRKIKHRIIEEEGI